MNELSLLRNEFLNFAQWHKARSPMYHFLATCVAECYELLSLAVFARAGHLQPALFFASVNSILQKNPTCELAQYYPNHSGAAFAEEDLMSAFREFCFEHISEIQLLMATRLAQSTDVQRSTLVVAGLSRMNQLTGGNCFTLIEVGCPLGLLLNYDRYAYDFDEQKIGNENSPVRLNCEQQNQPTFELLIPLANMKFGIDPHPVDLSREDEASWSRAFIPADQTKKIAQFDCAVEMLRAHPVKMIRGEVMDRFDEVVSQPFTREPVCVLQCFTLRQPSLGEKHRFETRLSQLSTDRDVWRLSLEWPEVEHTKLVLDHFRLGSRVSSELVATCRADGGAIQFHRSESQ